MKTEKGVCYLNGLPGQMSVMKVKELLQPYGIDRVYFKVNEKGSKRTYSEGWVEFTDKKIAKMCALSLNGTNIVQKKHKQLSDYMWQIKYLSGFKWEDLNENFNHERRISKKKMEMEMNQARKCQESQIIMIIIVLLISYVLGLPITAYLKVNNNKYYIVYENGELQNTFNPILSEKRVSCTPPKIVALGGGNDLSTQVNYEDLIIAIDGDNQQLTIDTVVSNSTKTQEIQLESFVVGSSLITPTSNGTISLYQICPKELNNTNYWTFIDVTVTFADGQGSLIFGFTFTCDQSYKVITFDWSLLILVVLAIALMGVLAKFSRINSFSINIQGQYFQGFNLNWIVLTVYLGLYALGFILATTTDFYQSIRVTLIAFTSLIGFFSCFFIFDEILCLTPSGTIWKRELIWRFRFCDFVALLLAIAIMIPYAMTKAWYLSDFLSITMMGTLVKIFKLNNLKSSYIFMIPCVLMDIIVTLIIHFTEPESYNVLTLKYLNCPLELQLPLINLQFSRNCAWISLFSIAIPGLFIGLTYRFDQNKRTFSYAIISFASLLAAEILWMLTTVYQTHSWPSSVFTFPAMLISTSCIALKRNEFRSFWEGNFFDEYLEKNFRIQSLFNQKLKDEDGSLTMKLMEGLDQCPDETQYRQQSSDT